MCCHDVLPMATLLVQEAVDTARKTGQRSEPSPSQASITSSWSKYSLAASSARTYSVKVSLEGASSLPCHLADT